MDENIRGLITDYCEALRGVRELKAKARKRQKEGDADLAILKSMEEDLEWTIEYMLTGHIPVYGKRRCMVSRQKGI
ncbi:MAG: hypothetical protein VB106_15990 [Clostridiaceae bacterium]|jgi:hypothetical protein|nr:hypothetical protein [Clostridiaceae bacterium]